MKEEELVFICKECVGDEFLKERISKEGEKRTCSYCKKAQKAVSLVLLAEEIHYAIEKHFNLTPTEPDGLEYALLKDKESDYSWTRKGEEVKFLIEDIVEISDELAEDVQKYLSLYYGGNPMDFEEDPYGDEACYEEKSPESYFFQESWDSFCNEVRFKARYFGSSTIEVLDTLFSNLVNLKTFNGTSVIVNAGPNTQYSHILRARVCHTQNDLIKVLKNPIKELGSPPSKYAKRGRLNSEGISVFYGAESSDTCIAEVRPPVGSNVVIGKFQVIRSLRLLNLDLLTQVYARGSFFDPEYKKRIEHVAFLKHLVDEFTKPVMPGDEAFEYLPTQIVAEYLAEKVEPKLDGIIFRSSQSEGEVKNITLFQNTCQIKQFEISPKIKVNLGYGWYSEDNFDDSITIIEGLSDSKKKLNSEDKLVFNDNIEDVFFDNYEPTLLLDVKSGIDVRKIKSVRYETRKRSVTWYRNETSEDSDELFNN